MNVFERMIFESRGGMFREFEDLNTHFEPKDSAVQLTLEFHPGVTRQLAPREKELAENESFFKGDIHQLDPPGRGPRVLKISFHHAKSPRWSPEHGMVRVWVSASESWAGLIPQEAEFPGTCNHFSGGFNLVAERIAQSVN